MRRPVIIDAFCKAGGAGMGYHRAGWYVNREIERRQRAGDAQ